jgi:hypothetical protein
MRRKPIQEGSREPRRQDRFSVDIMLNYLTLEWSSGSYRPGYL